MFSPGAPSGQQEAAKRPGGPQSQGTGWSPDFPHPGGVIVDKLPNFLAPQSLHLESGGDDSHALRERREERVSRRT